MLNSLKLFILGFINPRIQKFHEAQTIYDFYTRNIDLKLEGPTTEQCHEARSNANLKDARELYFDVLELCRKAKDDFNMAVVLYQLGLLERLWGNNEQAAQHFSEALAQFEKLKSKTAGTRSAISCSHFYLGHVLLELGDYKNARAHLKTALEIDQVSGDSHRIDACNALLERCQ